MASRGAWTKLHACLFMTMLLGHEVHVARASRDEEVLVNIASGGRWRRFSHNNQGTTFGKTDRGGDLFQEGSAQSSRKGRAVEAEGSKDVDRDESSTLADKEDIAKEAGKELSAKSSGQLQVVEAGGSEDAEKEELSKVIDKEESSNEFDKETASKEADTEDTFKATDKEEKSFGDSATQQARRAKRLAKLKDILGDWTAANLCATHDWAKDKDKFEEHLLSVFKHTAEMKERLSERSPEDKVTSAHVKQLLNEARELEPCNTLSMAIFRNTTEVDPQYKEALLHGFPSMNRSYVLGDWCVMSVYSDALETGKAGMLQTDMIKDYMTRSSCSLKKAADGPLALAFTANPSCENDCEHPALDENNLTQFDNKDLCTDKVKVAAVGSGGWNYCGWSHTSEMHHTSKNYGVCYCGSAWLNGSPHDVDVHSGCTEHCELKRAQEQKVLELRSAMISQESFGKDCDFGVNTAPGVPYSLASKLRTEMDREHYRQRFGSLADAASFQNADNALLSDDMAGLLELASNDALVSDDMLGSLLDLSPPPKKKGPWQPKGIDICGSFCSMIVTIALVILVAVLGCLFAIPGLIGALVGGISAMVVGYQWRKRVLIKEHEAEEADKAARRAAREAKLAAAAERE